MEDKDAQDYANILGQQASGEMTWDGMKNVISSTSRDVNIVRMTQLKMNGEILEIKEDVSTLKSVKTSKDALLIGMTGWIITLLIALIVAKGGRSKSQDKDEA